MNKKNNKKMQIAYRNIFKVVIRAVNQFKFQYIFLSGVYRFINSRGRIHKEYALDFVSGTVT